MPPIPGFQGAQYSRDDPDYNFYNKQYATSSYQIDRNLNPAHILHPKTDEDVIKAVRWATHQGIAIAIKSGGHQYSGASSTGGKNIQLDLDTTYKDLKVNGDTILAGASVRIKDLLPHLAHHGLFIPFGQCPLVALGGHVQTGGYGQMARSFGLLGDHILSIRMIDHSGNIGIMTKDDDLYYGILGGSPGNFGIITHYTIKAHKSNDYIGKVTYNGFKGPHMIKALFSYDADILKALLSILITMSDAPRGYDLCISVFSTDDQLSKIFPSDKVLKQTQHRLSNLLTTSTCIVVYASWCPFTTYDSTVDSWFAQFRNIRAQHPQHDLQFMERDMPMSRMPLYWINPKPREFNLPYIKRTYTTSSTDLSSWVDTVVNRIAAADARLRLSLQFQAFGGPESQFYVNRNNGTSYSWRDSPIIQVVDSFHQPEHKEIALQWQNGNDEHMQRCFSKQDRRLLWGSWGDWTMSRVWQYYYEDGQKYARLGQLRSRADPNGTFTPNPFAVKAVTDEYVDQQHLSRL